MPISTATIRSKVIVASAVRTSTRASDRVERSTARTLWTLDHADRGHHQDAGERGERDLGDQTAAEEDHDHEHECVDDGRKPCSRAGADIDRRAGDRSGCRHSTEQRRHEVGQALPEQLAIGVVAARVAMPSATFADSRLSIAASKATASPAENRSLTWSRECRAAKASATSRRQRSDAGDVERRHLSDDRRDRDREQRRRERSAHAGCGDHDARPRGRRSRAPPAAPAPPKASTTARPATTAVFSPSGLGDAERSRDLLQEDDGGDADGEALDHRPRDVGEVAAETGQRRRRRPAHRR